MNYDEGRRVRWRLRSDILVMMEREIRAQLNLRYVSGQERERGEARRHWWGPEAEGPGYDDVSEL